MPAEQQQQVLAAIAKWNTANASNGSGVTFVNTGPGPNYTRGTPILTFNNGANPYTNSQTGLQEYAPGAIRRVNSDGSTTARAAAGVTVQSATLTIDATPRAGVDPSQPGYPAIIEKIVLHELGHTMGLGHVASPTMGGSVMNNGLGVNDINNRIATEITSCDNLTVTGHPTYGGNGQNVSGGSHCDEFVYTDADGDGLAGCEGDCDDTDPFVRYCEQQRCIRETCPPGWSWWWEFCTCRFGYCPILVDVDGDAYRLTSGADGVFFDLDADGTPELLSWTAPGADDAWLALDRNGNGAIDDGAELFGNFTPQPDPQPGEDRHGFRALAQYDKPENGGDISGWIGPADAVFASLRLWRDVNHDGRSQPHELYTLPSLGVMRLDLDYRESGRRDRHGNRFKYRARIRDARGAHIGRWAWDVYLVPGQ